MHHAARSALLVLSALAPAACGSASGAPGTGDGIPEAPPITLERNAAAREAGDSPVRAAAGSRSRVLAYVNDEVVSYHDVLVRAGQQLAVVATDEDRARLERTALTDILRERILHRAAVDAGIALTRDEVDAEGMRRIRGIERTGTFERYLAEQGMSRREFEDQVQVDLRVQKYIRAAVGMGGPAAVQVRAVTDTWVSPLEVREYYERNPERFRREETASVRVLMLQAATEGRDLEAARADVRRRADAALSRLRAGEDWVPVYREAMRAAPEPDPADGLLEIPASARQDKHPRIVEFAYTREKGTVEAFSNPAGTIWFVLRAEGHSPERTLAYEEVHEEVRSYLQQVRRVIATFEVELSLLEEAAVSPPDRLSELRELLLAGRRKAVQDAGR